MRAFQNITKIGLPDKNSGFKHYCFGTEELKHQLAGLQPAQKHAAVATCVDEKLDETRLAMWELQKMGDPRKGSAIFRNPHTYASSERAVPPGPDTI